MATTAKPVRGSKFSDSGEEDIAAIAKQISDHAEAIYQTWKARGLAPSEILSCHGNTSAADTFGATITPQSPAIRRATNGPPVSELLAHAPEMSNNNLEKLVNNFVVEDKARVAARNRSPGKSLPSSIQYALQKFEKVVPQPDSSVSPKSNFKPLVQPKPTELMLDTIEITLPKEVAPQKPQTPVKPAGLTVERPNIQSWPLKNKINRQSHQPSKGANLLDEVSREEERLINALKTGIVINDTAPMPVANAPVVRKAVVSSVKTTQPVEMRESKLTTIVKDTKIVNKDLTDNVTSTNLNENIVWKNVEVKEEFKVKGNVGKRSEVPHPEVVTQRMHLRTGSPIRPFLTRGSVAERVLIFEKCPSELRTPRVQPMRDVPKVQVKPQPRPLPPHTTLQRHVKANRNQQVFIPKFYFPHGKPVPQSTLDATLHRIQSAFNTFPNSQVPRDSFHHVVTACGCPVYWRAPLYLATQLSATGHVDGHRFIDFWKKMVGACHEPSARFVHVLTRGNKARPWLLPEDFAPLVQDVVECHPGLSFLKEATEFHSRYVHTVIARIFYCVNRSWSGRITVAELRRSDLLQVIRMLEEEEDINQITAYFSYEHFYVIYCKFWELDRDHDLYIDKQDLARHNDHALSSRMIERIFSGCVTRGPQGASHGPRMSYTEFVWFLLAEEDKTHPTAIEYWFRCMDLDGDGVLSMYELEYFYEEQTHRMESIGIETLPFEDCLCQMLDMIHPSKPGCISLQDLKHCRMTPIFFDTFFNLEKYLDHEQRDPFANQRDQDGDDLSDWDRFAAEEYELLVAEEGVEAPDTAGSCDEDEMSQKLDNIENEPITKDSQGHDIKQSIKNRQLTSGNITNIPIMVEQNQANTIYGAVNKEHNLQSKVTPYNNAKTLYNGKENGIYNDFFYNGDRNDYVNNKYNNKSGLGKSYHQSKQSKSYDVDDEDDDYARDSDECSI